MKIQVKLTPRYGRRWIVQGLAVLLLAGCASTVPDSPRTEVPATPYPHIAVLDNLSGGIIADRAKVVGGGENKAPLNVTVPVRWQMGSTIGIQYRFEFLSSSGVPLETQQAWRHILLEPKVQTFLQDSALDTRAVEWRLEIRENRPGRQG